ncbi:MAG: carboxypeptidase-like regulatory domain-containing protein [Myxococcota bacterium]|nr:carboxypeptidase-like regulatory domain-containing protein [Myxococcota bacterium]
MRNVLVAVLVVLAAACGPDTRSGNPDGAGPADACVGIGCQVVDCAAQGKPPTSVSGTVYAPNGTLPLYGATVYVPLTDPGPWPTGVQCSRCESQLPGAAAASTTSGVDGKFTMTNVPAGSAVPLFITIGKWRRKVAIPSIEACTDNPLPAAITSLPKNKTEGELPKIAMGSGGCDQLECLLKKLGVADSEFTHDGGTGSIHLFNGGGLTSAHGQPLAAYSTLTGSLDKLKAYDIIMFSCDCSRDSTATRAMMDNVKAYADLGGRAFFSHYHSQWLSGNGAVAPTVWPEVAQCNIDTTPSPTNQTAVIDQTGNPKGPAFAQWMVNVMGSTTLGQVFVKDTRKTCTMIDPARAERWVHLQDGSLQNFQLTTPVEAPIESKCGKVVMSDMHVSGGGTSGSFPAACNSAGALSPQEKALAFMFFDIAGCVGEIL